MSDTQETRKIAPRTPPRARRSTAALVAQYIHELSERHAPAEESAKGEDGGGARIGREPATCGPPASALSRA